MHRLKYWYGLYRTDGLRPLIGLTALLGCNHSRTPVHEGKCFCPDCGEGVIFQWVVLHCAGCRQKRDSRYWLRQVVPVSVCCSACGEARFERTYLENPQYYQLHKARLLACGEADFLSRQRLAGIRVWLDQRARLKGLLPLPG